MWLDIEACGAKRVVYMVTTVLYKVTQLSLTCETDAVHVSY